MPKLKVLSGEKVVDILLSFGFAAIAQKGSHKKLVRVSSGVREIITVPQHKQLSKGTTKAIYSQALQYISREDLQHHFYTR